MKMKNKYKIIILLLLSFIFHSFGMYFLSLSPSNINLKEFVGLILFTIHIFILVDIIDIIKKPKLI